MTNQQPAAETIHTEAMPPKDGYKVVTYTRTLKTGEVRSYQRYQKIESPEQVKQRCEKSKVTKAQNKITREQQRFEQNKQLQEAVAKPQALQGTPAPPDTQILINEIRSIKQKLIDREERDKSLMKTPQVEVIKPIEPLPVQQSVILPVSKNPFLQNMQHQ